MSQNHHKQSLLGFSDRCLIFFCRGSTGSMGEVRWETVKAGRDGSLFRKGAPGCEQFCPHAEFVTLVFVLLLYATTGVVGVHIVRGRVGELIHIIAHMLAMGCYLPGRFTLLSLDLARYVFRLSWIHHSVHAAGTRYRQEEQHNNMHLVVTLIYFEVVLQSHLLHVVIVSRHMSDSCNFCT